VRIGPDGFLYLSIGSSCNACEEADARRAALLRYRPDGWDGELFATGLRNAVGFDWRPQTGELYATDNGRDLLGDDFPPCELNRIVAGGFYGWPYANGDNRPDPDLGPGHEDRIRAALPPVHAFRAHNAPLGIAFVRSAAAPPALRGAALVALHGSWNRTRKDGYKVVSLHWQPDARIEERDFLVGFERQGDVIGRPVDVAEGPDGSIYVSDDYAGSIYRVAWTGRPVPAPAGAGASPVEGRETPAAGASPLEGRVIPAAGDANTTPAAVPSNPLADLDAQERERRAARGRELYASLGCAGCHEPARAEPGVVARPLVGLARRHSLAGLARFLAAPTPPMPAVDLGEDERTDLAVFLLAEHP
jgi:mono/diheme cytochrome c family protein